MEEKIPDNIALETLEAGAAYSDFDTLSIRVRCVRCHEIIETTPKNIKELLTFYRHHGKLELDRQFRFRIPFLRREVTITLWRVYKPELPKFFFR
jgi:hypothetical protein